MRSTGIAILGLFGGLLAGFIIEVAFVFGSRALFGNVPSFLIFVGFLPYLLAIVGAVAAPVVDARRRPR